VTQAEINRTAEGPPRLPPGPTYWLITTSQNEHREVLTLDHDGEEMLPVFSHEEEAEMFLRLGGMGYGWRVGKSSAHELVSVLYGPCAGVREVALDPLPEMVAEGSLELVSLLRERFIWRIVRPEEDPSSYACQIGASRSA
jgi:hypothetical protein